jgi:hypothetical protein
LVDLGVPAHWRRPAFGIRLSSYSHRSSSAFCWVADARELASLVISVFFSRSYEFVGYFDLPLKLRHRHIENSLV